MTPTTTFLRNNAPWLTAGAMLTLLSSFGQTFFISIFAGVIQSDYDLSHGEWGRIYSVGTFASAVVMVWAGGLADQFRARALGTTVLIVLAVACAAMAMNPFVLALYAIIFALRLTGQGMLSHISMVAMARWFVATRGRALSIAGLGYAFGEAVLPLTFVALLGFLDWRVLWWAAAVVAVLAIPVLHRLLREERTPQAAAKEKKQSGMQGKHWTRGQAMGHPLFWFMVPALLGPAAFGTAFIFQQVHYAEIKGWSHLTVVSMFPLYTGVSILAMLVSGWALDKWGTARLIPYFQIPMIVAFLCFGIGETIPLALLGFFFFALTSGAQATLPSAFWADFYGTAHIGSIKAMAVAVMVLGSAIGPGLTGTLIDLGVGLEDQYVAIAGYFCLVTVLMWIGVRRYSAQAA